MKRFAISRGVYRDPAGGFWARPTLKHRRTWRRLNARTIRDAVRAAAAAPWQQHAGSLDALARLYLDVIASRSPSFVLPETKKVHTLLHFFGRHRADEITLADLPPYARWRRRHLGRPGVGGGRAIDKDLSTLSNVLNYGVQIGFCATNGIRTGRPRYQPASAVRHCRECAPASADVIHRIADFLFQVPRSEPLAWQLLFAAFTGCRTSELLRLRLDAPNADSAGYLHHGPSCGFLSLGRRSKHNLNPFAIVGPEFRTMIDCYHRWHRAVCPASPWYFPSPLTPHRPIHAGALGHALLRACRELGLPHIIPHGLRSWYVTKRRSDGVSDAVIAGEIGDSTSALMEQVYGSRPPSWTGGAPLSWAPKDCLPAWLLWQPIESKIACV